MEDRDGAGQEIKAFLRLQWLFNLLQDLGMRELQGYDHCSPKTYRQLKVELLWLSQRTLANAVVFLRVNVLDRCPVTGERGKKVNHFGLHSESIVNSTKHRSVYVYIMTKLICLKKSTLWCLKA